MHVFGLTGGLASGKSSVARLFREWGVPVVDADQVAREIVEPGQPALAELVAAFGTGVLDAHGALDRKSLAATAFATPEGRTQLGAITHPRIAARSAEHFAALAAQGEPLAAYEAALLVENKLADMFRPLVVVATPRALQIARAMKRDAATAAEVEARLDAQQSLDAKVAAADVVIQNDGTAEQLASRAAAALRDVCTRLHVDPSRYRIS